MKVVRTTTMKQYAALLSGSGSDGGSGGSGGGFRAGSSGKKEIGGGGSGGGGSGPDGTWNNVRHLNERKEADQQLKSISKDKHVILKQVLDIQSLINNWKPGDMSYTLCQCLPGVVLLGSNWLRVRAIRKESQEEVDKRMSFRERSRGLIISDEEYKPRIMVSFYGILEVLQESTGEEIRWDTLSETAVITVNKLLWHALPPFYGEIFEKYFSPPSDGPIYIYDLFNEDLSGEDIMVLIHVYDLIEKGFDVESKGKVYKKCVVMPKLRMYWAKRSDILPKIYQEMFPWDRGLNSGGGGGGGGGGSSTAAPSVVNHGGSSTTVTKTAAGQKRVAQTAPPLGGQPASKIRRISAPTEPPPPRLPPPPPPTSVIAPPAPPPPDYIDESMADFLEDIANGGGGIGENPCSWEDEESLFD